MFVNNEWGRAAMIAGRRMGDGQQAPEVVVEWAWLELARLHGRGSIKHDVLLIHGPLSENPKCHCGLPKHQPIISSSG